jgi:general secretion pathway protein H
VGSLTGRPAGPRERGFTLIELMVVLVIAGIVLTMVAVDGMPGSRRGLSFEAERLAQVLALARDEAQVRGQPLRLQADDGGYRFLILSNRQWQPLLDDSALRARAWDEPTRLTLQRPDGGIVVEFGRDSIDLPFKLVLTRDSASVAIAANGLGLFEVR